ncbi:ubiquinol-cytochrome c reductase iron-sulfur subunit [Lentibacillus cibarius]|uniref:Menaquinol:cytochrome c reductase iron-sulfur subunit n=1 Tax=Lentibacillus cibarius TaxID=2583219 RepID=A0A549YL17_9BACI|nr:ubiquinol-cytochrome c reductase iron-sulfur subunit [Lentibacillus cibarius]TMN20670.1 ubiquinol-cytochrome c reductase iron-sulfur subunit [Lentibacillus cibarius]TRM12564.1 ubiquinol-cytochrome c reductase iron-sulfur subunit [Lentibacillus cibarius]
MSEDKQPVSRRQFLNYTLTGVGGFMAAGLVVSPIRMAIDPVLQESTASGDYTNVKLAVEDITEEPQRVDWEIQQVDGWYESKVTKSAWVYKDENGDIVALSPICKHLGCIVSWAGSEDYPNQFYCPCHDGRYYKNGVNVPNTPPTAPLDVYDHKIENGMLFLGKAQSREEA